MRVAVLALLLGGCSWQVTVTTNDTVTVDHPRVGDIELTAGACQ